MESPRKRGSFLASRNGGHFSVQETGSDWKLGRVFLAKVAEPSEATLRENFKKVVPLLINKKAQRV